MIKAEKEKIKEYIKNQDIITTEQLKEYISMNFPNRKIDYLNFYIYDLKKDNIIYQLKRGTYKYSDLKKPFIIKENKATSKIWNILKEKTSDIKCCIWQTSDIYGFMIHQPFKNYIIVEVENVFCENIFYLLKDHDFNVFLKPTKDILDLYNFKDETIIVRPIPDESPIISMRNSMSIAGNKNYKYKKVFPAPLVEKLLVDIFCEKIITLFDRYGEMFNIFHDILKLYQVDFTKLERYARNRNRNKEIIDYIENVVRFDTSKGEFLG